MKINALERLLPLVEKPSRYIDNEINAVHKDFDSASFRACLAFPDLYELGVSHLGLKILYSILNRIPWAMADRCYLPWLDMIKLMREEKLELWGLESKQVLRDFDLIGITLQSELTFTNILELLDLAGLALHSGERQETDPIVMAGGPCANNPLPLAQFIDVFFLGEAEEGIVEIATLMRDIKGRKQRLEALSRLESCYVPQIHGYAPSVSIRARKYDLFHEGTATHSPQILSWQLATHNRYVSEIMRGCSRGCRFCHAGYFYRPVRERNADQILEQLLEETRQTGWDEAGLISLSSSDYSCIKPLLLNLLNALDTNQTHVSLPSLRVDSLDDELVQNLKDLGREGLTIAPEAGSQRLRDVINKNLTQEQIVTGIETALKLGWQKIKFYFMIGLPTETDEDITGIIDLLDHIDKLARRRLQINVTLSPFVPKVSTPFQWEAYAPPQQSLERILRVKHEFKTRRNIKIKYHNLESSLLEAILSRGDVRCGDLLLLAWQKGAIYDGWNESFSWRIYSEALEELQLDPTQLTSGRDIDADLPWAFIENGVCKSFLLLERQRAYSAETTPDCRELCSLCGVCDDRVRTVTAPQPKLTIPKQIVETASMAVQLQSQFHYRVYYKKCSSLRFIAHLDWMRMLFRFISNISLATVYTQGFNPHPKVSLSPPLPIGVTGEEEYFDISYLKDYSVDVVLKQFENIQIPGFEVFKVEIVPNRNKVSLPDSEEIRVHFSEEYLSCIEAGIAEFDSRESFVYTKVKEKGEKSYELKDIILSIQLTGQELVIIKSLESPALYSILEALFKLERKELYSFDILRRRFFFSKAL